MPREHKKRGRRAAEKKRKADEAENEHHDDSGSPAKRTKYDDITEEIVPARADYISIAEREGENGLGMGDQGEEAGAQWQRPYYGSLDDDEQAYFLRAGDMLDGNAFSSSDDRLSFIAQVHKEADGKELKLANSQSCSRILERLIWMSNPNQLKRLFKKFEGK